MMYFNKKTVVRSGRIVTGPEDKLEKCPIQNYDIYQNYIDELDPSVRFDKYYFISPSLSVHVYKEQLIELGDAFNYEDSITFMIEDIATNGGIIADLERGETCIIFDMGVELVGEENYRLVDRYFGDKKFSENVKYWTMYENCDAKGKSLKVYQGNIEIISASRTALRYGDWDWNKGLSIPLTDDKPRHILTLNRRLRSNRVLLMAELLKRNLNLSDDFYLSFLGSTNDDIPSQMDKDTILGFHQYHVDDYSKEVFERIVDEVYGRRLPYNPDMDRDEWFGSSNLDRVSEMFPIRQKSYVEVITEFTSTNNGLVSISEKMPQAILSKKPFIVAGDKGYMAHLRKLGFKTFDKFWSEEYDNGHDIKDRVRLIGGSIETILTKTINVDDYGVVIYDEDMKEVLEHNYNHYKNIFVNDVDRRILSSLAMGNKLKLKPGLTSRQIKNIDNFDWKDKIWYNENIGVAILLSESRIILDEISPRLGFKLLSLDEVDLENTSIVALTHDPRKRLYVGAVELAEELGKPVSVILDMVMSGDKEIIQDARISPQELPHDIIDCMVDLDNPYEHGHYGIKTHDVGQRLHRIGKEISHIINRKLVYKSHLDAQMKWVSDKDIEPFKDILNSEYIYNMYKEHFECYFRRCSWRLRKPANVPNMRGTFDTFLVEFFEKEAGIIEYFKEKGHSAYFNASLKPEYWGNHCTIMQNIGLQYAPKDIKILDMGTHFGIIPKYLESQGFTSVSCTNSYKEAGDMLSDLEYMWNKIELDPWDIHIQPQEEFTLDKKYDVILVSMSNIFWQADRLIKFTGGNVSQTSQVVEASTGHHSSFFIPYLLEDIKFFIENIKQCLEPGGIAVIQPYPFVYNKFDTFSEEARFLLQYQKRDVGYQDPTANAHSPISELNDYFVVQNI